MSPPTPWKSSSPKNALLGRFAVAAFFSIFLAAGLGFGYAFLFRPIANTIAARAWRETTCEILSSSVVTHSADDGSTYRVSVTYRYSADGRPHSGNRYKFVAGSSSGYAGKAAVVQSLPPGARTPCYYNPANPTQSVINRAPSWELLFGLIPLVFVFIGGAGLVGAIFGKTKRFSTASGRPTFSKAIARQTTTLKPLQTRGARFTVLTLVAIFWNGAVSALVWKSIQEFSRSGVGFIHLFVIPFIACGVLLIVLAIRSGLALANPRATLVVSSSAVAVGDEVTVNWSIDGHIDRFTIFSIDLEGREEATYRRGTDTRTDRKVFATIPVTLSAAANLSRTGFAKITVPAGTMHSFEAKHNKIVWVLHVRGTIPRWPDCDDEYPLTVAPKPT